MNLISLLNRISLDRFSNNLIVKELPILLGTIRGGHTSLQNWMNVTILDYLDIKYKINSTFLNIELQNSKGSKPLEACDLRSFFQRKYPLWGYISNNPGFTLNLVDRNIFIFIRSPKLTFKSIYILSKYHYRNSELEAKKFTFSYFKNWSERCEKLVKNKSNNNIKIHFFKSENLFASPSKHIQRILNISGLYVPNADIFKSIDNYNNKSKLLKKKMDIYNPRNSFKNKYIDLNKKEEDFIESLFLYKFYFDEKQLSLE